MLTFKEYISEQISTKPGNYVCLNCNKPNIPDELLPKSGKQPDGKHHMTLMYSEHSNVDSRLIQRLIDNLPNEFGLNATNTELFDSRNDDGEINPDKKTLVLRVQHPFVDSIHDSLKRLGMQHSYEDFSPHITLAYDCDTDEAQIAKANIDQYLMGLKLEIPTTNYEHNPIDKNWVSKL